MIDNIALSCDSNPVIIYDFFNLNVTKKEVSGIGFIKQEAQEISFTMMKSDVLASSELSTLISDPFYNCFTSLSSRVNKLRFVVREGSSIFFAGFCIVSKQGSVKLNNKGDQYTFTITDSLGCYLSMIDYPMTSINSSDFYHGQNVDGDKTFQFNFLEEFSEFYLNNIDPVYPLTISNDSSFEVGQIDIDEIYSQFNLLNNVDWSFLYSLITDESDYSNAYSSVMLPNGTIVKGTELTTFFSIGSQYDFFSGTGDIYYGIVFKGYLQNSDEDHDAYLKKFIYAKRKIINGYSVIDETDNAIFTKERFNNDIEIDFDFLNAENIINVDNPFTQTEIILASEVYGSEIIPINYYYPNSFIDSYLSLSWNISLPELNRSPDVMQEHGELRASIGYQGDLEIKDFNIKEDTNKKDVVSATLQVNNFCFRVESSQDADVIRIINRAKIETPALSELTGYYNLQKQIKYASVRLSNVDVIEQSEGLQEVIQKYYDTLLNIYKADYIFELKKEDYESQNAKEGNFFTIEGKRIFITSVEIKNGFDTSFYKISAIGEW